MEMLKGKVALITGSGRGIGRAIALKFAREGADVISLDIDIQSARETTREVESLGRKAQSYSCDISNFETTQEVLKAAIEHFGKLDILVNNAGITKDNLLLRMTEEEWDLVLKVNLKGVFNVTKSVLRQMLKQKSGKIINIASVIGIMGNVGQANYAASKAGLIAFTKSLAKEVASRNINVNAIAPGYIQTRMTESLSEDIKKQMLSMIPLSRFGAPEDVANCALFLASSLSDYITGQVIVVDGGLVM
ncbi:MAG: beta-ketoacyl-ACP reductase [Candidatus Omnitrophica bacterium 4484_49]|nr:3-oxoacyl-[acyl-carrier-protein] reductase [Candidatus Omnitrophota bacterium]OQX83128.1 MAG: beta-ketoacyl-ACP reductase [Candidatus Omnitrophica bacterium 4484_49]